MFDICCKEKAEFNADKLNYLKVFVHCFPSTEHNVSLMYYAGISLKELEKLGSRQKSRFWDSN
jgi:hypothetical protein